MGAIIPQQILAGTGTVTFDPSTWSDGTTIFLYTLSSVTLSGNIDIEFSAAPSLGNRVLIVQQFGLGDVNLNGHTFTINGQSYLQWMVDNPFNIIVQTQMSGVVTQQTLFDGIYGGISGASLLDHSITIAKLSTLTAGHIILGNASNVATDTAVSGDVTITNAGVTAIAAGVIVDADINATAAIARTKIAAGTASQVVINDGSGNFSSEAQLANTRGGTGLNSAASTGFAKVASGTWSVGAIGGTELLPVSFETGELGDFKITMGYAGTVVGIYAFATKVIAGTDNGTITPKNNAGTTMTGGVITFTASDARGTAYSSVPTANNTFIAGDVLDFSTAKTTAGGKVQLSISITRTS